MKSTPVGKSLLGTGGLVQGDHAASLSKKLTMDVEGHGEEHTVLLFFEILRSRCSRDAKVFKKNNRMLSSTALHVSMVFFGHRCSVI
jgi:hypothetical protein